MNIDRYKNGLDMEQFKNIKEISSYNFNYYVGLDNDLLFCMSDDDNTSQWWVITGTTSTFLGESYCTGGEKLHRLSESEAC